MKLNGMAEAFKDQFEQPDIIDLSFEDRFALLVDRQWIWKEDRRMRPLLRLSRLRCVPPSNPSFSQIKSTLVNKVSISLSINEIKDADGTVIRFMVARQSHECNVLTACTF